MFKKFIAVLLVLSCSFVNINCATIVNGRNQKVPVVTIPDGATVTMETTQQISPATLSLDRSHNFYVIKVEKEGYKTVEITLKRGNNGWLWGNVLFGGIIGLVIDFSTSSAYKFIPDKVNVNLEEANSTSGAQAVEDPNKGKSP